MASDNIYTQSISDCKSALRKTYNLFSTPCGGCGSVVAAGGGGAASSGTGSTSGQADFVTIDETCVESRGRT